VLDHNERVFDVFIDRKYRDEVETLEDEADLFTSEMCKLSSV
jgi:hypothetical protein